MQVPSYLVLEQHPTPALLLSCACPVKYLNERYLNPVELPRAQAVHNADTLFQPRGKVRPADKLQMKAGTW